MSRYELTREAAFDLLIVAASHTNRKLRGIAAESAAAGEVQAWWSEQC